ncbi:MAG: UDP-3-O-(3-hydroxymyristoyl)glucosamine N-acyltransferase [Planctomycetota bacterium]
MPGRYRLEELARRVGGRVQGDPERRIRGIATLAAADPDQLSFLTNVRYARAARATRAGAVLVGPESGLEGPDLLVADEPQLALARLLELFHPAPPRPVGVSPDARLASTVRLGRDVAVGPFAVVERDVSLGDAVVVGAGAVVGAGSVIGAETELKPRVVVYPGTRIGERCLVHAGVVLGGDGYGFATSGGVHHKVPQVGGLIIGDDVEIGANTTVDRGALDDTRIGSGTKLDNLVMIAHGVQLGEAALMAAQTGISGSTRVGRATMWGGQSGAAGHLEIADGSVIASKSAVYGDIRKGAFVAGIPAVDHRSWKRSQAIVGRLPQMRRMLRDIERRLGELERRLSGSRASEEED